MTTASNLVFTSTVTKTFDSKTNTWSIYNWLNNVYATFEDQQHPIYLALQAEKTSLDYAEFSSSEALLEDLEWLKENQFFISSEEAIAITNHIVDHHNALVQKRLDLILLPADEACNFNCVYCYEDHESRVRMGQTHLSAILKWIDHAQPEFMNIEYFGGEPLLNSQFILDLNQAIKAKYPHIVLQSSITTNGALLTESLLEQLVAHHVRSFQITLDGLPEDHNVLRVPKRNTGTYDAVYSALELIARRKDLNIYTILRTNFNQKSATPEKRQAFIEIIKNLIQDDQRFFVSPKMIGDFSATNQYGNQVGKQYVCSKQEAHALLETYESELLNAGLSLFSGQSFGNVAGTRCYAGSPTNFLMTPDFKLKKCTVVLTDPLNNVGNLNPETGIPAFNQHFNQWVKPIQQCYSTCYIGKSCQSSACPLENIKQQKSVCLPQKFDSAKLTHKVIQIIELRATTE